MSTQYDAHMDMEDGEETGGEMTLLEHLGELRRRVIYSFIAVAVGFGVSWTWVEDIFKVILLPLEAAAPEAGMGQINYKDLTEPFFTLIKTAIVAGVFLAIPVIFYQLWKFVAPGLYKHERRMALPFVLIASVFFFVGTGFCYGFVMPYGFEFLFKFSQGVDANPTLMMSEHYNLAIKLLLAFGIVFEMPVAAMFLSAVGVITHRTLIEYWRISVVAAFIFAAMLTPPDIGTQLAMAIPLIVLYGISIGVAYVFTTRRERKEKAMMDELG